MDIKELIVGLRRITKWIFGKFIMITINALPYIVIIYGFVIGTKSIFEEN